MTSCHSSESRSAPRPPFTCIAAALIFALFLVSLVWSTSANAVDHSGTCSGTFLAVDNPHQLVGTCTVPAGETLTLEPGVVLDIQGVAPGAFLDVDGTLLADNVTSTLR